MKPRLRLQSRKQVTVLLRESWGAVPSLVPASALHTLLLFGSPEGTCEDPQETQEAQYEGSWGPRPWKGVWKGGIGLADVGKASPGLTERQSKCVCVLCTFGWVWWRGGMPCHSLPVTVLSCPPALIQPASCCPLRVWRGRGCGALLGHLWVL